MIPQRVETYFRPTCILLTSISFGESSFISRGSPVSPAPAKQEPDVSIHRTDLFLTTRWGPRARGERRGGLPKCTATTKHRFHRRESDNTGGNRRFRLLPIASRDSLSCFSFLSISLSPLALPSPAVPLSNVFLGARSLLSLPVESQPPGSRSAGGHCRARGCARERASVRSDEIWISNCRHWRH